MIKRFLDIYEPGEELTKPDETLLNFGRQMLPPEIMYLWENYGFGDYGNGLLKVVDPRVHMARRPGFQQNSDHGDGVRGHLLLSQAR